MTSAGLAARSLRHYWRTNLAVAAGVACAVAVFAGALLVGASVRESLRELAVARLGRTDVVVTSETPFSDALAGRLSAKEIRAIPIWALDGTAEDQSTKRRASHVHVYGVDARFFAFHGVQPVALGTDDVLLSPDLTQEVGANPGDVLVLRVPRPSDIPLDSLHASKEAPGESLRLTIRGVLARDQMGEFSLAPQQGPVRALFVSSAALERALALPARVNTMLAVSSQPITAEQIRAELSQSAESADFGLNVDADAASRTIVISSTAGMLNDALARAIHDVAAREKLIETGVLTWLANEIRIGDRAVPYSLVTALDARTAADGDTVLARLQDSETSSPNDANAPPIVFNDWAARDLDAKIGDAVQIEYYRWSDEGRLVTEHATFRAAGVVPIGAATAPITADRRLTPTYPGITDARSVADWDPPFPIDLKRVRPKDDEYWREFRTTPKAFIPLAAGQRLWQTRHGALTSIRLRVPPSASIDEIADRLRTQIPRQVDPTAAGFRVIDVRRQAADASGGATDFAQYFSYFSGFLMISALLLAALFFRLSVEQRLREIGVLRAVGIPVRAVRRVFLIEAVAVSVAGAILGVALAIGWAELMMIGLRTRWIGAVGTTLLRLHVSTTSLGAGAAAAAAASLFSVVIAGRKLVGITPRALLTGNQSELSAGGAGQVRGRALWLAGICLIAAAALCAMAVLKVLPAVAGFFGAGALTLISGLSASRALIARVASVSVRRGPSIGRLAIANLAWRSGRTMTAIGLVGAAVFVILSIEAFRHPTMAASDRHGGTGGFALLAESALPLADNPATVEGRRALGIDLGPGDLRGVDIVAARLRPGDDASCLNLYRPSRPRVVGVSDRWIDEGRFSFSASLAATGADRQNPWRLLRQPLGDDAVPAIADATSLEYVLHASVGDVLTIDADTARPIKLRIVGAVRDSILQGEIVIAERAFLTLFPTEPGYRMFFVDVPDGARAGDVARTLEDRLELYTFDAQDTRQTLDAYHRVEDTYLSTFQTLGGLGLILGCGGLGAIVARNVLERRRELALLGAAGFSRRQLQRLMLTEQTAIVAAGLAIGVIASAIAIAPALAARGFHASALPLGWLALVAAAGLLSSWTATRAIRRLPLVSALRSE